MIIIYKNDVGTAIIYPSSECGLTVEQIAKKDVPQGVAYRIVENDSDVDAISFDTPDGYGDPEGYWAKQESVL